MATPPFFDDPASTPGAARNLGQSAGLKPGAPTTQRTVEAAHRSIDNLGERASRSEQSLRGAVAESAAKYQETQDQLRSQVNDSVERTRSYVREHPFMAAGAAFAAGALFTAILKRR